MLQLITFSASRKLRDSFNIYIKNQAAEEQEVSNRLVSRVCFCCCCLTLFWCLFVTSFFGRTTYLALPRSNKSFQTIFFHDSISRVLCYCYFLWVVQVRPNCTHILSKFDFFISLFDRAYLFKDSFDLKFYPCYRFTLSLAKKDEELRVPPEQFKDKTMRYLTYNVIIFSK